MEKEKGTELLNVFISSTFVDLVEYRKAAIEVVNRYKCVPLAMEFFLSRTSDPETVSKDEIEECDLFIGIYAHRFGWGNSRLSPSFLTFTDCLSRVFPVF